MSPILIVGAVALVAAYVARKASADSPGGYVAGLRCKAARTVAAFYGRTISDAQCALADKVDDTIGGAAIWNAITGGQSWGEKDAENKSKNGPVDLPLSAELAGAKSRYTSKAVAAPAVGGNYAAAAAEVVYTVGALLHGSVLRFANGGVPFAGHPDWSKCVPGTHDMTGEGNAPERFWNVTPGKRPSSAQFAAAMKASTPDKSLAEREKLWAAIGVRWGNTPRISDLFRGSSNDPATSVALSIVAGVKYTCPASGQVLYETVAVTDNRSGAPVRTIVKRCAAPGSTPTPYGPAEGYSDPGRNYVPGGGSGSGSSTAYVAPPGAPPPGFHWVQASGTTPAHWERDR